MKKPTLIAILCALLFPTIACAKNAMPKLERAQAAHVRQPAVQARPTGFVLRQDLFDRNDPNNLRSDWPAPVAQPGQF